MRERRWTMLRFGIRWGMAITLVFLVMVTDGHAQRLLETDGIELRGTARVVTYGAAVCNVVEASHTEEEYERIKANHGQPLDVWQLDFSVRNGSGRWLDHLIARYGIESKWPPCTNWSGDGPGGGPSGTYSGPVEWASTIGHIQKSGRNVVAPGATLTATAFIIAFHEDQPRFENWSLDFTFGKSAGSDGDEGRKGRSGVSPGQPPPRLSAAKRKAKQRLPFEPEMVVIPGGRFRMGCVSGRDCQDDERPVHEVRVESFEISKYEVTFEEYDRFTAATGRPRADDEGWGRGRRPVINVSWEYAVAYVEWLSAQTGKRYRLPSEAEWEYAVRAGTETAYSWGNEIGRNRANCYDCGSQWDRSAPTPGDCTTCTGTYGNGCRTAGMRTTKVRLRTDRPGREVTARVASCAAARGTSIPGTFAPRTAAGAPLAFGTAAMVSVWPGRSPLESSLFYLGGSRACPRWESRGQRVCVKTAPWGALTIDSN